MKYCDRPLTADAGESHPTGVRGLKSVTSSADLIAGDVAPHWGAWIEINEAGGVMKRWTSHPTGVRGLK